MLDDYIISLQLIKNYIEHKTQIHVCDCLMSKLYFGWKMVSAVISLYWNVWLSIQNRGQCLEEKKSACISSQQAYASAGLCCSRSRKTHNNAGRTKPSFEPRILSDVSAKRAITVQWSAKFKVFQANKQTWQTWINRRICEMAING